MLLGQKFLLLPPRQLSLDSEQLQAMGDSSQPAFGLLLDLGPQELYHSCHVGPTQ